MGPMEEMQPHTFFPISPLENSSISIGWMEQFSSFSTHSHLNLELVFFLFVFIIIIWSSYKPLFHANVRQSKSFFFACMFCVIVLNLCQFFLSILQPLAGFLARLVCFSVSHRL